MKYYIIAGEASGDVHGAALMKALKKTDDQAQFRFWGGDKMLDEGGEMVMHYRDTAFMGIFEVLQNLKTIKRNFATCHQDLLAYQPDVLILIDYPGFNLRIAEFAKNHGMTVYYYISPKIWAWKTGRIRKIKVFVDHMFCILPFEKAFYQKYDFPVDYVGNPLADIIAGEKQTFRNLETFKSQNGLDERPIIAILPGSRVNELKKCMPYMLKAASHYHDFQMVVSRISSIDEAQYQEITRGYDVKLVTDCAHELLYHAHTAVVVSGTAVLETALLNVPQVALYKLHFLTFIFKPFLKIKYFTLPNIIMNKGIYKEFLQHNLTRDIRKELQSLLYDASYREAMQKDYAALKKELGAKYAATEAARLMVNYLKQEQNV